MDFQNKLLTVVIKKYADRKTAIQKLSNLLGVEKNSIYRRIKGTTPLTSVEINLLAKTHNISLDNLISKRPFVQFEHTNLHKPITEPIDFLNRIHDQLQALTKVPNIQLLMTFREVPFFQYLSSPELAYFKFYMWSKTSWSFENFEHGDFDLDEIEDAFKSRCLETWEFYKSIPSTEVWSSSLLEGTMKQIQYSLKNGYFRKPTQALRLLKKLEEKVNHLEEDSKNTIKRDTTIPFYIYVNENTHLNNTILVRGKNTRILFNTMDNPNYVHTFDESINFYMDKWFWNLLKLSQGISNEHLGEWKTFFRNTKNIFKKESDIIQAILKLQGF